MSKWPGHAAAAASAHSVAAGSRPQPTPHTASLAGRRWNLLPQDAKKNVDIQNLPINIRVRWALHALLHSTSAGALLN